MADIVRGMFERALAEVVIDSALIVGWDGERKEAAVLGGLFYKLNKIINLIKI